MSGTSASFSDNVVLTGSSKQIRLENSSFVNFTNTGNTIQRGYIQHDGTNLNIASPVGYITLINALSGTSATFSSTLTVNGAATFTAATPLIVKGTNASTMYTEYYYNTSTLVGYIGNGSGLLTGANASDFITRSEANYVVATGGNNKRLTIASGGNVGINQTPLVNAKLYIRGEDSSTNFTLITDNTDGIGTFSIRNDGVIASGTATNAPYNYAITSTRDLLVDANGNFGTAASIRKAKINIENESNVNWLYDLNPVKFNYRQRDENRNYLDKAEEEQRHGLIAEEVEEVNADFCWYNVNEEGDKELVGVDYKMLITPMLKAIQEQQTIIEDLKTRIEQLEV